MLPSNLDVGFSDLLRVLLIFMPGAVLMGLTLAVVFSYYRAYRVDVKIRRLSGRPVVGLLTGHVSLIGTSYLLLVAVGIIDTLARLNEPLELHAPFRGLAFYLGCIALYKILRFEHKRYQDAIEAKVQV